tara:strand:+ start:519 stop:1505 length:987 start_codon:yes stop_codon:yes gene_type:complete
MNNEENISIEDRRLANELLNELHSDKEGRNSVNRLHEELFAYKYNITNQYATRVELAKKQCWNSISEDIFSSKRSSASPGFTNIITLNNLKPYWKVAAIILFTILLSIFYLQIAVQQPTLIVSSESTIETVELSDGSIVTLRPNSSLYSVEKSEFTQAVRLDGEAFFSISNHPERTFLVEAGNGFIEVLGTQFNIRTWQNSTTVFLESGSLRLSSLNRQNALILQPGQVSTVKPNNQISDPTDTEKEYYTSWRDEILLFNNRQASTIFRELEYHFSIHIEAPSDIENTPLGGSISLQSLQTALQNLGVVLDGEFVLISGNRYRFEELK